MKMRLKPKHGRNRRWYGYTYITNPATGKRRQIEFSLDAFEQEEMKATKNLVRYLGRIERGDFTAHKVSFKAAARAYLPKATEREEIIIRCHLSPYFNDFKIGEIKADHVRGYHEANIRKAESTLKKELRCLKKIIGIYDRTFQLPSLKFVNKGRRFDETQILEERDVLGVVKNFVYGPYKIPCLVAAYSSLRLGNVVGLKKKNVDLKDGWLAVRQTKTGKPVSIPISGKLRDVFRQIKVWPLQDEDYFFPGLNARAVSTQVRRSFRRAGIPFGSFHHFRHFAACYMINRGVPLEVVMRILGHADVKSTLVYARLKRETLKDAMRVFDVK
jgi:integrase